MHASGQTAIKACSFAQDIRFYQCQISRSGLEPLLEVHRSWYIKQLSSFNPSQTCSNMVSVWALLLPSVSAHDLSRDGARYIGDARGAFQHQQISRFELCRMQIELSRDENRVCKVHG